MPIYEYRCQSCGHELEATQRIVEPPLTLCPACNQNGLERLISRTAFHLKGGGWYKDLYSSKKGDQRTDNDRIDRLSKAVNDDKDKTAASSSPASDGGSSASTSEGGSSSSAGDGGSTGSAGSSSSGAATT